MRSSLLLKQELRRVFAQRSGITVSTIHGVKGAEYDVVIAYALLDGMEHFSDETPDESALKLLYVICLARAKKSSPYIGEKPV